MHRTRLSLLLATAVVTVVAGCSRGSVNDAGRYCAALQERVPLLEPTLSATSDVPSLIATYQELHDVAPLSVQPDWEQVIELIEAASAVQVTDQAAVADLNDQAFSTAAAATRIADHAASTCGITMSRPGALPAPGTTIEVPPTTVADTSST